MAKFDGKCDVLLVLAEKKAEIGEKWNVNGWALRVVTWSGETKKGKAWSSTKLEKRQFYIDEDQAVAMGKAEGFNLDDMGTIQKNWKEIIALLTNPPAVQQAQPTPESQQPAGGGDDLEVPF